MQPVCCRWRRTNRKYFNMFTFISAGLNNNKKWQRFTTWHQRHCILHNIFYLNIWSKTICSNKCKYKTKHLQFSCEKCEQISHFSFGFVAFIYLSVYFFSSLKYTWMKSCDKLHIFHLNKKKQQHFDIVEIFLLHLWNR